MVDIGKPTKSSSSSNNDSSNGTNPDGSSTKENDSRVDEMVSLLGEHMPNDPSSLYDVYLPAFMSL